jgi:hypothetical protein
VAGQDVGRVVTEAEAVAALVADKGKDSEAGEDAFERGTVDSFCLIGATGGAGSHEIFLVRSQTDSGEKGKGI